MWGDIVDSEMVVDLVGFIHQCRRTVVITVAREDLRKSVYFRQGAIMAASSSLPEDRFGNIMFRRGMITREQLTEALAEVLPGRKIGNILMARGLITGEDLWKVLKVQIEEILYSILLFDDGEFTIASYEASQVPTRTALDSQHVLLEGLRRKDEMRHLQGELPEGDIRLIQAPGDPSLRLEASEQVVFDLIDGQRTVEEALVDSGLGQFAATRALHRLLKAGVISKVSPGLSAEMTARPVAIIEAFNRAFERINQSLMGTPVADTVKAGFESFFADAGGDLQDLFAGIPLSTSGRLAIPYVVRNLNACEATNKHQLLSWGLRDYLRYLLFTAREWLPYEQVEALAAEVSMVVDGV